MKLQLAIILGVVLVGSIATVNMAFVQNNEVSANSLKSVAGMVGHITLTATDEDGNISAYRQTDNVVINGGDNCLLADTFNVANTCGNTALGFDTVHIGSNNAAFSETSTNLVTWEKQTGGSVTSSSTAVDASGASVTVTAAFLDVDRTIAEAALMNTSDSAGGDVLALQNFSPIALGSTDDLTIEWTVTIDGN